MEDGVPIITKSGDMDSGLFDFELTAGPFAAGELRVASFRCKERMSRPFSLEVTFSANNLDPATLEASLIGQPASLVIHVPGGGRRALRGIVARLHTEGLTARGRQTLRIGIVPRLWLLKRRKTSRIFQDLPVAGVIAAVLGEASVPHALKLLDKYPVRSYCVQYQETDFDFLTRLCAEEGIFYWFDHPPAAAGPSEPEIVVFSDDARLYPMMDGSPSLHYREASGSGGMLGAEDHVHHFEVRRALRPTSVLLGDYDFRRPLAPLTSSADAPEIAADPDSSSPLGAGDLRIYDHHGEYEEPDVAKASALSALEQQRSRARVGRGESACRRLGVGRRFTLDDHGVHEWNIEYVLTGVDHEGFAPDAAKEGRPTYSNRFECVPSSVRFRPKRPRRRLRQVMETALVVGPDAHEVFTDQFGRIKVQFHWDLDGKRNERSSCWMRVSQAWAGSGWGFQFIPRVGMEVIVTFLGGDVDRPMVTGCVYNGQNPPPFSLPLNSTKSGIRTRTLPGGSGNNELSFEDLAGSEEIYLHAQRNLTEVVEADHESTVKRNRTDTVMGTSTSNIAQGRVDHTGWDHKSRVLGSSEEFVGGDRSESVEGNRRLSVRGNDIVQVGGSSGLAVEGGRATVVGGDMATVARGSLNVSVGDPDKAAAGKVFVWGDHEVTATGLIRLRADKGILIECGSTSFQLTPDSLALLAKTLSVTGESSVRIAGEEAVLELTDKATLHAKKILQSTDKAALMLEKEARLDGVVVKLNCDPEVIEKESKDKESEEEEPIGLESTLAVDQLTGLATVLGQPAFILWMMSLFGSDIPLAAYEALYHDLENKTLVPPPFRVLPGGASGHLAAYNRKKKLIEVSSALCRDAETNNEQAWVLCAAMIEEFGHHVDHVLRNEYSKVGGDAMLDEGARFGYAVLYLEWDKKTEQQIATHRRDGADVPIVVRWDGFMEQIDELVGAEEQANDDRDEEREYFGAGRGGAKKGAPSRSFGHESVEDALIGPNPATPVFSDGDRTEIYFGNWLRDFSQAIVPLLLRVFTRKTLTSVLDLLARQKFGDTPNFHATEARLGVYRAREHIDSPYGLEDGKPLDPLLDSAPLPFELEFNHSTWLRNHIATPGPGYITAAEYIEEELRAAISAKDTPEGRRRMGQALHTLEDFYAHSNFIEVALHACGETGVIAWIPALSNGKIPVITGCFGGIDTAASIILAMGEMLQKDLECIEGKRSAGMEIGRILLSDTKPHWGGKLTKVLEEYEAFEKKHPRIAKLMCKTISTALHFIPVLLGTIARALGDQIDDAQTIFLQNPGHMHPTHSQIAKDHDDHPLHALAAELAKSAVLAVGEAMKKAWAGTLTPPEVCRTATRYLVHPEQIPPGHEISPLMDIIRQWAADPANRNSINRLSSSTWPEHMSKSGELAEIKKRANILLNGVEELPKFATEIITQVKTLWK
ncbi:MAG: type VI secretion system tip protein VgrG [Polyangiaceae bacterium]|nr:type VI secretion system tip protein VgrG [Polyangiaceae bacterium]